MERSHKKRKLQQQTTRNLWLVFGGIIALILILLLFGSDLIIGFAVLLNKVSGTGKVAISQDNIRYVANPLLDSMNDATNSATIIVTGTGEKGQTIKLYVNG